MIAEWASLIVVQTYIIRCTGNRSYAVTCVAGMRGEIWECSCGTPKCRHLKEAKRQRTRDEYGMSQAEEALREVWDKDEPWNELPEMR